MHLSDISWDEPGEEAVREYKKGDEIETVILSIDSERERISLGIKQLSDDPFVSYVGEFEKGSIVNGVVASVEAKSAMITLKDGVEGLVHVSEMDWTNKNVHPSKVVQLGDVVDVMILDIDEERRRISLGIK